MLLLISHVCVCMSSQWPASGEIDLVESRGNAPSYGAGGVDEFGSTLHFGNKRVTTPAYHSNDRASTSAGYVLYQCNTWGVLSLNSDFALLCVCVVTGPYWAVDAFATTHATKKLSGATYADDFHVFGMLWDEHGITTYLDNTTNVVLRVDFNQSAWQRGGSVQTHTTHSSTHQAHTPNTMNHAHTQRLVAVWVRAIQCSSSCYHV